MTSATIVWPDVARFVWIVAQLTGILLLARAFHIENPALYNVVLPLALGGFLVHHWLPRRYQPPFFAALSFAGIVLIFGVAPGAWLVGVGLGLIAICHVPVAFKYRVMLLLFATGVLVAMRATWLPAPWPGAIWPVLGSMFMFRLVLYLYDLKHRGPASPGIVLSYFFLLPNTVFLLFPVIDFQTFRRTYFDRPAMDIYAEGIHWIFRGLIHLVLYRLLYQYVTLSPGEVTSTAGIVQYLVGNYGLYLRVSGQFHVIVGLLHLFGFRLPETHRFFYLASSFSDLWRRINIYWKDFMQKMVYLPVVFSLKRRSETTALVAATVCVVITTWLLHSYQWFWLLGTWLFSTTDIAFWVVIGLLLVANTLREQRRGRARQLTAQAPASAHAWRDAMQTAGMFTVMAVLWGVWTSPTFEDFRVMVRAATIRPSDVAAVLGTLTVVTVAAYVTRRYSLGAPSALAVRARWQHPLIVGALPLTLFWLAGEPALSGYVPAPAQEAARHARIVELNNYDAERLQRGYYEEIVGVNQFNGELWEVYARAQGSKEPVHVGTGEPGAIEDHFGNRVYRPSASTVFRGGLFSTNRWGFRDQDYKKTPRPNTVRVAVLGPSFVLGSGVNNGEPFEQVLEDRLNREWKPQTGLDYEFLNLAMGNSSLVEQVSMLESGRVGQFQPQVVLVVGHTNWHGPIDMYFAGRLAKGRPLPAPVDQWAREAGIEATMSEQEVLQRLLPRRRDILQWALGKIVAEVHRIGAKPLFALIPMPLDATDDPERPLLLSLAHQAGMTVIDMQDVFDGYDHSTLVLSPSDRHPNAEGHRIIAGRLFGELSRRADALVVEEKK